MQSLTHTNLFKPRLNPLEAMAGMPHPLEAARVNDNKKPKITSAKDGLFSSRKVHYIFKSGIPYPAIIKYVHRCEVTGEAIIILIEYLFSQKRDWVRPRYIHFVEEQ